MTFQRVLITGASGFVGRRVCRLLQGKELLALGRKAPLPQPGLRFAEVDLVAELEKGLEITRAFRPDVILYLAALSGFSPPESEYPAYRRLNTEVPVAMAEAAKSWGGFFAYSSTDMVFDGTRPPYRTSDLPTPLSIYGQTKVAAETALLAHQGLVVRFPLLYGLDGTFLQQMANLFVAKKAVTLFSDEWRTPVTGTAAAKMLLELIRQERRGLFHLGGPERISRLEMGQLFATLCGHDHSLIKEAKAAEVFSIPRPRDLTLDSSETLKILPANLHPSGLREGLLDVARPATSQRHRAATLRFFA